MPFELLRPPCVQLEASCGYKSANTVFQVSKHSEPYSRANEWTMYSRFWKRIKTNESFLSNLVSLRPNWKSKINKKQLLISLAHLKRGTKALQIMMFDVKRTFITLPKKTSKPTIKGSKIQKVNSVNGFKSMETQESSRGIFNIRSWALQFIGGWHVFSLEWRLYRIIDLFLFLLLPSTFAKLKLNWIYCKSVTAYLFHIVAKNDAKVSLVFVEHDVFYKSFSKNSNQYLALPDHPPFLFCTNNNNTEKNLNQCARELFWKCFSQ